MLRGYPSKIFIPVEYGQKRFYFKGNVEANPLIIKAKACKYCLPHTVAEYAHIDEFQNG